MEVSQTPPREILLDQGWELALSPSESFADPAALADAPLEWLPALVPGTAASSLRALGRWSLEEQRDFDAEEIWYRLRFKSVRSLQTSKRLRFEGLATLADAWLNGAHLLRSENMFVEARAEVTALLREENELLIRFASLKKALAQKRPRPRWKTRLVEQQQLRWIRTTLLGRIPGWTPKAAAVGPWRSIVLEEGRAKPRLALRSWLEGNAGVVRASISLPEADLPRVAWLEVGGQRVALTQVAIAENRTQSGLARDLTDPAKFIDLTNPADLTNLTDRVVVKILQGELRIDSPELWWPHTHGAQPLYPVRLLLEREGEADELVECGQTGFRKLELDQRDGGFALRLNGAPIFCRGACWTTLDPVTLHGDAAGYRAALTQARECGMNMLRVGGTMTYESDSFHALCDELGILVFQDFQFANLDYPAADANFASSVREEAEQFLGRTQLSPSLAILCGGSEVEQQAAMLGVAGNLWSGPLFQELLSGISGTIRPDIPYISNSPTGGPLPFTVSEGLSHYYGVGAYLRPLEDARRANVRFTSECLAFANVPEQALLDQLLGDGQVAPHHPRWKSRVPRDTGAGWDFDDVRDHYLKLLYSLDPVKLRWSEPMRYLQLSRAVSGEVMAATFAEWRRARSSCKGGLVWFLRDLWAGAGWGLVDSSGAPKPAWWFLKRELQPISLVLADEGVNGLRLHAINETAESFSGELRLALYRDGEIAVAEGKTAIEIPPRGEVERWGEAIVNRFTDSTWAYRFGPPGHDLAVASLRDSSGALLRQAFYFPLGRPSQREREPGLEAQLVRAGSGFALRVKSRRFAQSVALEVEGAVPEDNWFHLEPGVERTISLCATGEKIPRILLEPLNGRNPIRASEG